MVQALAGQGQGKRRLGKGGVRVVERGLGMILAQTGAVCVCVCV